MAKIGFIGLGVMGAPMALNLQNGGHQLFVHTRTRREPDPLDNQASYCASATAVARQADIIFLMLPTRRTCRRNCSTPAPPTAWAG
jgi:2-hydroxy-3-oxopropionate reductase